MTDYDDEYWKGTGESPELALIEVQTVALGNNPKENKHYSDDFED